MRLALSSAQQDATTEGMPVIDAEQEPLQSWLPGAMLARTAVCSRLGLHQHASERWHQIRSGAGYTM